MKIVYKGWTFQDAQAENVGTVQEQSLSCENISADVLTASVRCADASIINFRKNDPVKFWKEASGGSVKTFYLRSISRTGAQTYKLIAWSAVSLLAASKHVGGIYTGQTLQEVVSEICGNIPVLVESIYSGQRLYGWLPYAQPSANGRGKSARDNLAHVLFVAGAYLGTDQNGVLRVEKLWKGVSSSIAIGRMYLNDGSVGYGDPVSSVSVAEHQYVAGTDEKELFSGTAQAGDIVTFSEPMHSLTAEGFTILESNANYAKLSAGTGTLKGKTYIHNTRLVTRTVTAGAAENVVSVTDATLVSLVNSAAVANRLAEYYKQRETISNGVIAGAEKPGHVVSIYHPYDKKMVSACVESLDTTMSATLKSNLSALVGFIPPQPEASEYYDERVVLTGSGEWTVPEGVTSYTKVLISGGQGGKCGKEGSPPTSKNTTETSTRTVEGHTYTEQIIGFLPKDLPPAPGGDPGDPGEGGKVLVKTVTGAVPGSNVSYTCGVGGAGAPYAENSEAAGSAGTSTQMGGDTSESGSSSAEGYTDPVTGETYAARGVLGVKGSDGVGYDSDGNVVRPPDIVVDGVNYTAGASSQTEEEYDFGSSTDHGSFSARSKGGNGGGPAYKANGGDGGAAITPWGTGSVNAIYARSGDQGTGATAQPPEKPTAYGTGGTGGNGGGGNGQTGWGTFARCTKRDDATGSSTPVLSAYPANSTGRGLGSAGGEGADGCIIIYYRRPKAIQPGWLKDKNGKPLLDRLNKRLIV